MILKNLRLKFGLARARRKLLREKYEAAQYILVGMLNAAPDAPLLPAVFTMLAETEFHREHFRNSMHYAKLAIAVLEDNPSQLGTTECQALHDRMRWYIESGVEKMKQARLEFVAKPPGAQV